AFAADVVPENEPPTRPARTAAARHHERAWTRGTPSDLAGGAGHVKRFVFAGGQVEDVCRSAGLRAGPDEPSPIGRDADRASAVSIGSVNECRQPAVEVDSKDTASGVCRGSGAVLPVIDRGSVRRPAGSVIEHARLIISEPSRRVRQNVPHYDPR